MTRTALEKTLEALAALQKTGKTILFVSTKPQSIALLESLGQAIGQPTVTKKWMPGLLTNWPTIRRRIKFYLDLKDGFATGSMDKYTKKEQTQLRKQLAKLDLAFAGVAKMRDLPDAVVVIDAMRDHVAVLEAKKLGIPVYGICDSNANPDEFTLAIPANDDAVKSIELILGAIRSTLERASAKADDNQ
jgi:small subunit ribosomal protein S2